MIDELLYSFNIEDALKNIKKPLMKECLNQKTNLNEKTSYNFEVCSKYTNYLYDIFYNISKVNLNTFSLKDVNFKMWAYVTDKDYSKSQWHNHKSTSSINCVLYLKTQNKGITFQYQNQKKHLLPKDNVMLIFPSFLDHLPDVSKNKPRITLNLELRCNESVESIFKLNL
jgi:hypothetical protein|tara:strand:- start:680 stop:1189 length:510 start_codon:yes stop_codon:yes gene_type:complete